jgi:hypothetical protein
MISPNEDLRVNGKDSLFSTALVNRLPVFFTLPPLRPIDGRYGTIEKKETDCEPLKV